MAVELNTILGGEASGLEDRVTTLEGSVESLEAAGTYVAQGGWDASSGSFPAGADQGFLYEVTVAGTVDGVTFSVGDQLIAITDSASTTTFAGNWFQKEDTSNLSDIASTISKTAVDVFVYDTSLDSDGGAWRKRTQNTSWYNETLNTATRGDKREFPAVAVIVAESNKVTIYDGDDPSLPMWMVFNQGGSGSNFNFLITSPTVSGCTALNGKLCVSKGSDALIEISFIDERVQQRYSSGMFFWSVGIVDRNSTPLRLGGVDVINRIVSSSVNDVAMTVLPDAPVDPATGLPVPTIAVATDGGVSVITDSGAVYDSSETAGMAFVTFNDKNRLFYNNDASDQVYYADTYAADGFSDGHYDTDAAPYTLPGNVTDLALNAIGQVDGLTVLAENPNTQANGMVNHITSSYQTGWMNGDIKGAFLSDTDDTDLTDAELVTNGTFDTDTDWTLSGAAAITGGELVFVGGGSGSASQPFVFSGGFIQLQLDKTVLGASGAANVKILFISSGVTAASYQLGGTNGPISYNEILFIPSAVDTLEITYNGSGAYEYKFDNVSVKLADADRSVNANGLIVNGTITRTPVATDADLVAYSGFSATNYLEMPYNSDLDFGTGDFAIMGWLKQGANTAVETILERDSATTAQRFTLAVNASGFLAFTCDDDTTARTATSNRVVDNDVWTHFVALYDGAGDVKIYLNGVLDDTETGSALLTLNNASAVLNVGLAVDGAEPLTNADLALLRISATVPSDSQIRKIYEDERVLFQENAQATLYGTSDAVTALAHDPVTDLLHVGTSAGRSVFQGLRRVSNTTDAVGTAISAVNDLVVED